MRSSSAENPVFPTGIPSGHNWVVSVKLCKKMIMAEVMDQAA